MNTQIINNSNKIYIFHLVGVSSLFFYLYFSKNRNYEWFYHLVLLLSIFIFTYHGIRFLLYNYNLINLFHISVVAPLLVYYSYYKGVIGNVWYYLILFLAMVVILYHGWKLYLEYSKMNLDNKDEV